MITKRVLLLVLTVLCSREIYGWGFFAHEKINFYAVFLLPPEMLTWYKLNAQFLAIHAVDPDKRRYAVKEEGPRHYIDLDRYGNYPFDSLPRSWKAAVEKFGEDSLQAHGVVPWWIQVMLTRLTAAFREKDANRILKLSAELGHYLSDAHVPLHASSNHNGQKTGQEGIHGFWESRVPELLADHEWDFIIGRASYISHPLQFTWLRVLQSAAAADTVLRVEKDLSDRFSTDRKYAFEERKGKLVRQYSSAFTIAYEKALGGMVERRMRQSVEAVASFWFTAWVLAGQPDLSLMSGVELNEAEQVEFESLNLAWKSGVMIGRKEDE
jgi:hypothetical protein